jgi:hypothetical protein
MLGGLPIKHMACHVVIRARLERIGDLMVLLISGLFLRISKGTGLINWHGRVAKPQ